MSGERLFNDQNQLPRCNYIMHRALSLPSSNNNLNLNKFNYRSRPAHSLHELLESEFIIRSLEISPHGKTGVIFVETDQGSFVLKSNNQGPIDQFLNRMAGMLGLRVPESICYSCSDVLFHKLIFSIQRFCERDEVLYARLKSRLDFPFYQIIEYIPSISLAEVGQDRFERHLLQVHKLNSLGMCIGFDLLTNNSDRFKLLWGGEGNINNVLIEVKDFDAYEHHEIKDRSNLDIALSGYVFIDHSGYLLDLKNEMAARNFEKYMNKVCDFHIGMIRALSEEYPMPGQFQRLRQQLKLFTHYDLNAFDLKQISRGIVYITNRFLQVFEKRMLQELYSSMKKEMKGGKSRQEKENNYWHQYWNQILSKINLQYLQEVFNKMAAIYTTYPEIVTRIIQEVEQKMPEIIRETHFSNIQNTQIEQKNNPKIDPTISSIPSQSDPQIESQTVLQPEPTHHLPQQEEIKQSPPQLQRSGVSGRQNLKKSALQSKQVINELKMVRKWRDKLVKYKEANSDQPFSKK